MITALLLLAGIIALILIVAAISRKDYDIRCEVIINAASAKVFDYVRHLKNQDNFNKWVMFEPDMKREFKGEDGTIGFIYGWNGKKAGEGEQEIKNIVDGKLLATEIRFVRPVPGIAYSDMTVDSISDHRTKVTWSNKSKMKYPMNILLPMIEKMLAKDMDTSLNNLKNILEK